MGHEAKIKPLSEKKKKFKRQDKAEPIESKVKTYSWHPITGRIEIMQPNLTLLGLQFFVMSL